MNLTQLIQHPETMDKESLYDLRSLIALHPYHQVARLLLLKNLYLLHDPSFDEELRRASLCLTDRSKIFNLIEAAHYKLRHGEKKAEKPVETEKKGDRTISLIDDFLKSIPEDEGQKVKRKPTPADAAVDYVAYLMEVEGEEESKEEQLPQMRGQELIDNFINNEGGKIQLQEVPEYFPEAANEQQDGGEGASDSGYFTETLAKIYIKQGRYERAMEIIRQLNLNYPKKNAYFADQMRFLEKLILNNKNK